MNKIKTLFASLAVIGLLLIPLASSAQQADNDVNLYFFFSDTCPHCAEEAVFLESIQDDYPTLNIYGFEVSNSRANAQALVDVANSLNARVSGVPVTIIGDQVVSGFGTAETTGKHMIALIDNCLSNECTDKVYSTLDLSALEIDSFSHGGDGQPGDEEEDPVSGETTDIDALPYIIDLPLFGQVDLKEYSLPVITVMIGFLDGFNPCAMWVLIFLISLLLGMKNRWKMWTLGTVFIIASSAVYFLFMAAWLNFLIFIGFITWIRVIIGIVAVVAGFYHLKEYYTNRDGTCKVTGNEKRKKIFESLKTYVQEKTFLLALGGIIVIAFAVNLVELMCSAGFPAIYTQVLALSDVSTTSYYLYILLYIFFFMLDDLIVFILAMSTLKVVGLDGKFSRYSNLIGGILILILGFLLILKPEWLIFG